MLHLHQESILHDLLERTMGNIEILQVPREKSYESIKLYILANPSTL